MPENLQQRLRNLQRGVLSSDVTTVLTRFSDLILVGCIGAMVGMMIVPLPTWLLDVLLTVNITIAVTVLMVSIYISSGTKLASFPTILLITTLYRLSLDISATRLILLQADAGEVIRSFGEFVVGGNFVVGAVIFLIITLVQFIVITKGSERVAEVAARFTLDAMPGKQMSIDADMRAGIIDFREARTRREALSREIAVLRRHGRRHEVRQGRRHRRHRHHLVNIVGGLDHRRGHARHVGRARRCSTYSVLTIGNGLVSQIPALLISISAGMVVTRVASEAEDTNLGQEVAGQVLAQPKAIAVTAGILFVIALVPGLPKIPFFLLAGLTGATRVRCVPQRAPAGKSRLLRRGGKPTWQPNPTLPRPFPWCSKLARISRLGSIWAWSAGQAFYRTLVDVRRSLYYEFGVIFPPLQINGNQPLEPGCYRIWLNEVPVVSGQLRTGRRAGERFVPEHPDFWNHGRGYPEPGNRKAGSVGSPRSARARPRRGPAGVGHARNPADARHPFPAQTGRRIPGAA